MPEPGENSPTRSDPIHEANTIPPDRIPGLPTQVPREPTPATTLEPGGPDAPTLAVVAATFHDEDQPPEWPPADLTADAGATFRQRIVVGTWSHGRIEAAEHARLARPVLLRILDAAAAADPDIRREFLRQARVIAGLDQLNLAIGILEAVGDVPEPYVVFGVSEDRPPEGLGPIANWLRRRGPSPYDNPRLASLLADAARGLQALHREGLVHGGITPTSLRINPHSDRLRLHDLPSMPLTPEGTGHGPPGHDLADLAAAVAVLVTGREAPAPAPRAAPIARALHRDNPGVDPRLALVLGRCLATAPRDRLERAEDLIAQLAPWAHLRVTLGHWGDRMITIIYEFLFSLVFAMAFATAWMIYTTRPAGFVAPVPAILWILLAVPVFEIGLGWSPGRRMRGLRLVNESGTRPPRWRIASRALLRFGWLASCLAVGFGLAWLFERASGSDVSGWGEVPGRGFLVARPDELMKTMPLLGQTVSLGIPLFLASGLLTRSRRPPYDVATGITWGIRTRDDPASNPTPATATGSGSMSSEAPAGPSPFAGRIGPIRLERELGRGGMGAVYAAWDEVLQRPVAVKLITEARDASPEMLLRFEQEARLAAQVRHANVAQVFSVGHDGRRAFMVLELLRGRTLDHLIDERGPIPLADAWAYLIQAATGLQAANRLGIVHRDIKPSNLMLTDDGVVKVLDFGISKLIVDEGRAAEDQPEVDLAAEVERLRSESDWRDSHLTRTGALLGTPLFMSPEQANARPLDCRSDIYSLGMTLYSLLAGRPPFRTNDVLDLLLMQCQEMPASLMGAVPELTPERAEVLERMIAKDPAARFQDYDELLKALDATALRPVVRATLKPRFTAALLDLILIEGIGLAFGQHTLPGLAGRLLGPAVDGLALIIMAVSVWRWGITPGKLVMRLRVTRSDGSRVGPVRSLLREFLLYPSAAFALLGVFVPGLYNETWFGVGNLVIWIISAILISRPRRQAIHDRILDTIVIVSRRRPSLRRGPVFTSERTLAPETSGPDNRLKSREAITVADSSSGQSAR